ncbi:zinc-dependent metalloprotease [Thermoflexibacter ruber]|uniref:Por secretion system C-terminal sorting domain-containing protein n=1 Tax=Thermoflexibacter ruber TaxID=1003 RepID=A0A1I2EKL4_9BACT|nr:M43 family zinc metalloprotease [Thermoflexibacter ruber]SFE93223.1 Por secretion system C-terminal sorting domain-containing protein [Thermoflexibacter ruber]
MKRKYPIVFLSKYSVNLRSLLLACFITLQLSAFAQNRFRQCAFDQIHKSMLQKDEQYRKNVEAMEAKILEMIKKGSAYRTEAATYIIPVVVHVMHTGTAVGTSYNISDAQIQQALDHANQLFAGSMLSTNTNMEFVLAKRSPTCAATTGINRVNVGGNATYVAGGIKRSTMTGVDEEVVKDLSRWSNKDYYNIWVVNKIDGNDGTVCCGSFTAGYAYFPGAPANVDGTIILASQMTNTSGTLAHELGHAFGLYHTFEGDDSGCPANGNCNTDGDKVCDTEPHENPNLTCASGNNPCTGAAWTTAVLRNIMNYSTCGEDIFTAGQANRMESALLSSRSSLVSSLGDEPPPASLPTAPTCAFSATHGLGNGFGIENFTFTNGTNTINVTSSSSAGDGTNYTDMTCNQGTTVQTNTTYNVSVKTWFDLNFHDVRIYIDFNNDGDFVDAGETVFTSNNSKGPHLGTVTIPASPPLTNTPLRMRVLADMSGGIVSPCQITGFSGFGAGQAEDYTIIIQGGALPTINTPTSATITHNSATLGATITADGGSAITERGIVWSVTSTNNNPIIGGTGVTKVIEGGTAVSAFTTAATGLPANTNISFKGYATNANGTAYTSVATFTTDPSPNPNLTVSANETHSGNYNNVTVTGTGTLTLNGNINVDGTFTIQNGGKVITDCHIITGNGNFNLQAGGILQICSNAGITSSGAAGDVQVIGTRTFSNDANYIYKGNAAQNTGNALPSQVRNLTIDNANHVTLSNACGVKELVILLNGNLISNGNLTLLSSASHQSMVQNHGTSVVVGNVTAQRHVPNYALRTTVQGYNYFSSPISNGKVSDFNGVGFAAVLNPAYDWVVPYSGAFPNVYRYNESKVVSSPATFDIFEKGWESPANTTENLEVGRGYILNLNSGTVIDWVGTLNNGDINIPITKGTATNSGWNLVGNPYPSNLDWDLVCSYMIDVNSNKLQNTTIHRRIATAPYAGTWATYNADVQMGTNSGTKEIAMGQGFFVLKANMGSDNLVFTNAMRTYNNTQFFRTEENEEGKTQGAMKLKLSSQRWSDETVLFFKRGATEGFDERLDVPKIQLNSSPAPSLYTKVGNKNLVYNAMSIENLPKEVPLHFYVASNGQHEISLSDLRNFKENLPIYLEDKKLGITQNLREKPYTFSANAGTDTSRFVLKFEVAFAQVIPDESLLIYPNPTSKELKINIDNHYKGKVQIRLKDMLGKEINEQIFEKQFTKQEVVLDLENLTKGVYFVEIQNGQGKQIKKIVKE